MKKILLFALVSWMISCSSPVKVTSSWVSPTEARTKFNNIMVLALAPAKYTDAGREGEEAIVAQLKSSGINAVSAQAQFGPQAFRDLAEEDAINKIKQTG